MSVIAQRERTFAFRMSNAVVSTIGIPENPVIIDKEKERMARNLNPRAVLLSIKTEGRKLSFAMYFNGSQDKEGYRQLVPFFHDAETLRLFDADVFLSYPDGSREIVRDSGTAGSIISAVPDFDFKEAKFDFGASQVEISLRSHNGVKLPESELIYNVKLFLKGSKILPVLERRG